MSDKFNVGLVIRSLDQITTQLERLQTAPSVVHDAAMPPPRGPSHVDLTDTEWAMYQTVADYRTDDFADAGKILTYLKARLGYHRLEPGQQVTITFRRHGSDVLLQPFDGRKANVLAVDQHGRAWVQFADDAWKHAVTVGKAHGPAATAGVSPYEASVYDNVDAKRKALRVDPLDTREYLTQLTHLGFHAPTTPKLAAIDPALQPEPEATPSASSPTDDSSSSDDSTPDDGADDESDGYFYDPLVRDLPDVSREQYLYVIKNLNDFGLGDWAPAEEHVLQAHTGGPMRTLSEIDQLLVKLAADKKPKAKKPDPRDPSPERGPRYLTGHGAKIWESMFEIPHVKQYIEGGDNPGHKWARAFSSMMAHHEHLTKTTGKFKPVMKNWDEKKHQEWAGKTALRKRKHGKRLKALGEHFQGEANAHAAQEEQKRNFGGQYRKKPHHPCAHGYKQSRKDPSLCVKKGQRASYVGKKRKAAESVTWAW